MATFSRPGVYIQEVPLPQAVQLADVSQSVGAMAGWLSKGSTAAPVLVSSWSEFVKNFGGLNDSYPTTWAAYNFFANGGRQLYIQRLAGTSAATGTVDITDGSGATTTATVTAASAASGTVTYTASNTFVAGQTVSITGLSTTAFNLTGVTIATRSNSQFTVTNAATGTAVTGASATATVVTASAPVMTLTAANPGAWSSSYAAQIVPGGSSTTFGLNIYSVSGTTYTIVESFSDLSMDSTNKSFVRTVINTLSNYITIGTSGFDATKTPYKTASLPTTFQNGVDGTIPGRTDYYNTASSPATGAWTNFDTINNPLVIYAPDAAYSATTTLTSQLHGDAISYASTRDDAFVVIDTFAGRAVTQAQADVSATLALATGTTGNNVAAYYPWVNIPDGTKIQGATRSQAPGASVVGQYLATDATRGVFKTPAGLNNKIALAVSTAKAFTNAELDSLNTAVDPINAIRQVPGAGIVIMGGRTLDNTLSNRYINIRRSLIFIEKQVKDLSSFAIFENNDSRLWSQVRSTINSFLLTYWQQGGLRGTSPTEAYYVKCDASTTSSADVQNGQVNIEIGVALEYPTEFVVIKIGQLTGSATA